MKVWLGAATHLDGTSLLCTLQCQIVVPADSGDLATTDQLASFSVLGAATGIAGAIFAGWLSTRIGAWNTYVLVGWSMIVVMLVFFAVAPRTANYFLGMELIYRTLASGGTVALLGMIMLAIGKGAASTKAAGLWSLATFALVIPTFVEGLVHDRIGTQAMLLSDAGLGIAGFGVLLFASRMLNIGSASSTERRS